MDKKSPVLCVKSVNSLSTSYGLSKTLSKGGVFLLRREGREKGRNTYPSRTNHEVRQWDIWCYDFILLSFDCVIPTSQEPTVLVRRPG